MYRCLRPCSLHFNHAFRCQTINKTASRCRGIKSTAGHPSRVNPYSQGSTLLGSAAAAAFVLWLSRDHITRILQRDGSLFAAVGHADARSQDTGYIDNSGYFDDDTDNKKTGLKPHDVGPEMQMAAVHEALRFNQHMAKCTFGSIKVNICKVPSNMPCEDDGVMLDSVLGDLSEFPPESYPWTIWGIFDGHAGHKTANCLARVLPLIIQANLNDSGAYKEPYRPGNPMTRKVIEESFIDLDRQILETYREFLDSNPPPADVNCVQNGVFAQSGSCALVSMYDHTQLVLRVANVGDSRAVLGRHEPIAGQYIAHPMSYDHTGFNAKEVARINAEHPGEDAIIDPMTGRLHGIAVTRAFGDVRWKWPEEVIRNAHEKYWGYAPRPNGVIKTPPYMTARPEITEMTIRKGKKGDFLIMASDGFWDHVSSDDAVTCVERWIEAKRRGELGREVVVDKMYDGKDEGAIYDKANKELTWKSRPEHFVYEEENCATNLVKCAFGGSRRNLLAAVLTAPPSYSRAIRDDVTVTVVFFGDA